MVFQALIQQAQKKNKLDRSPIGIIDIIVFEFDKIKRKKHIGFFQ